MAGRVIEGSPTGEYLFPFLAITATLYIGGGSSKQAGHVIMSLTVKIEKKNTELEDLALSETSEMITDDL